MKYTLAYDGRELYKHVKVYSTGPWGQFGLVISSKVSYVKGATTLNITTFSITMLSITINKMRHSGK